MDKKKILRILLTVVLVFNLACYQMLVPWIVSRALAEGGTVVEDSAEASQEDDEDDSEEAEEDEAEEKDDTDSDATDEDDEDGDVENDEKDEDEDEEEKAANETTDDENADDEDEDVAEEEEETEAVAETSEPIAAPEDAEELINQEEEIVDGTVATDESVLATESAGEIPGLVNEQKQEENTVDACACEEEATYPSEKNDECLECDDPCGCLETSIENENEAIIENETEAISDTGGNEIGEVIEAGLDTEAQPLPEVQEENLSGAEAEKSFPEEEVVNMEPIDAGNGEITTGDAVAVANAYNDVNTNIVSDNGERIMETILEKYSGDINLLEKFLEILGKASLGEASQLGSLEITNNNYAEISNVLSTLADSGENKINGDGEIATGDAVAVANAVNYINQNIIGENWIFAAITVFGEWVGNLIVPGEGLLEVPKASDLTQVEIVNTNEAEVENEVLSSADSGENAIVGIGEIATGDAESQAGTVNIVNTNVVKNNWFVLMVNNMGNWYGSVVNWIGGEAFNVFSYDFSETEVGDNPIAGLLKIFNNNTADVKNTVTAEASTGGNLITGDGTIGTGDATAQANVFNFINSNFIGDNWFFGIVNVMGTWEGDVIFAYPDLEVSITDSRDEAEEGEELSYTIAYRNIGQADSQDVQLDFSLPGELTYGDGSASGSLSLAGLKAGEEKSFIIKGEVKEGLAEEGAVLEAHANIATSTKEVAQGNNSASDITDILARSDSSQDNNEYDFTYHLPDYDSDLDIRREQNYAGQVRPGQIVKHSIIIENDGDSDVYGVIVEDKMLSPNGEEVLTYFWEIGNMEKGAQMLVEYDLLVNNPGGFQSIIYEARATGYDPIDEEVKSGKAIAMLGILGFSALAASEESLPEIIAEEAVASGEGMVLGELKVADVFRLPFWMWALAALAYYLAINWSLFPKYRKNQNI